MAKYRPIDLRLWHDRKFLSLSQDGRMLWLFLLTAPSTLPIPGVMVAGEAAIAEQLEWSLERLRERFGELFTSGLSIRVEGRLIWLVNALKYQPPANPNQIVGWSKCWDDVPEGELKHELWVAVRNACKRWERSFTKLFEEPGRNGLGNRLGNGLGNRLRQEQEQEQEQKRGEEQTPARPDPDHQDQAADNPLKAARHELREQLWRELDAARGRVAKILGADLRPLPAFDQGRTALAMRILEAGELDRAAADCRHVIAYRESEAISKRETKWLSGSMFAEGSWRVALAASLTEARQPPKASPTPEPIRRLKTLT